MGKGQPLPHARTMVTRSVYTNDTPTQGTVRMIGGLELFGAIGLIFPAFTGILSFLTPRAAIGLAFTMLGAMMTHFRRNEHPMIGVSRVLLLLAAFVTYERFVALPLS